MKMFTTCHLCRIEMVKGNKPYKHYGDIAYEIRADGIYNLSCSRGHRWTLVTTEHNYQMLFELGCMALYDGYTREAVTSFAVSLERFYEYVIELIVVDEGIEYEKHKETWGLTNLSERQLGAYNYLFLLKFREVPEKITNNNVKLRNKVVHNGFIPSEERAFKYGQSIFDLIMNVHNKLKKNIKPETFEIVSEMALGIEKEKRGLDGDSPLVLGLHRDTIFPRHVARDNHLNVRKFEEVFEYIEIGKGTSYMK